MHHIGAENITQPLPSLSCLSTYSTFFALLEKKEILLFGSIRWKDEKDKDDRLVRVIGRLN